MKTKRTNLFIDMDGVLAEQRSDLHLIMYDEGTFLNLPPMTPMVELIKKLHKEDVFNLSTLSTVIDSPYVIDEKNLWLDKYLPEIESDKRLFVPIGTPKSDFVLEHLSLGNEASILLDDFTENLVAWDFPGAIPIKILNGQNNTKGTWADSGGLMLNYDEIQLNLEKLLTLTNLRTQRIQFAKG